LSQLTDNEQQKGRALVEAATLFERADGREGGEKAATALVCWRHVLAIGPSETATDRALALCEALQDHRAMDEVLGLLISREEQRGPKTALLAKRAQLRMEKLADARGSAADWLRLLEVDGGNLDALRQLGKLADEHDDAPRAIEFYHRLFESTDSTSLKRSSGLGLAELLLAQGGRSTLPMPVVAYRSCFPMTRRC
jgi:tetratricopeptide (TPR) repeat protein